jgi:trehalose 6-phosphate phosphatase
VTVPDDLEAALGVLAGRRPLLVASDYDGVLSPIAEVPSEAVPHPRAADVLARLARVDGVTVALVSGRGVADLQAVSGFTGPYRWVGSHGAEFDGPVGPEIAARRDALAAGLERLVSAVPGARLEVKPGSVAVHVRQVTDRAAAAGLLGAAGAAADPSVTRKPGKEVLELALTGADKGTVVRRLRDECGAAGTIYLGDDVTDEDAFRALGPDDVTVKVGEGATAAKFRVPDPESAVTVLAELGRLLA